MSLSMRYKEKEKFLVSQKPLTFKRGLPILNESFKNNSHRWPQAYFKEDLNNVILTTNANH